MTGARRVLAAATSVALALAGAIAVLVGPAAGSAQAAARVSVSNADGDARADTRYATTLTVRGSGFQTIKGGYGGVYVMFGTVSDPRGGSWRPSEGGRTGVDYEYVPDSESLDNQGFLRFVAFPGSDTESAAHAVMSADGAWSVQLTVPSATFQAKDRTGKVKTVDCTKVTCGVITIGAHGVANANNETFTPVTFTDLQRSGGTTGRSDGGSGSGGTDQTDQGATGGRTPPPQQSAPAGAATSAPGAVHVGIDQRTAVVGRVLGFTGQGFTAGEQVVGSLGGGTAAVGPLTAGAHGEVAGVLQLPGDLRPGTQTFRLTGAASGSVAQVEFTVVADPMVAAAAANATEQPEVSPVLVAITVVCLLLLGFLVAGVVVARRRRRTRQSGRPVAAPTSAPGRGPALTPQDPTQVLPPLPRAQP